MLKTLSAFKTHVTPKPKFLEQEVNAKNANSISILTKLVETAHKTYVEATKFWEQTENALIVQNTHTQVLMGKFVSMTLLSAQTPPRSY